MRHANTRSRWHTPRARYSGEWRQNPWINSTNSTSQARLETLDIAAQDRQQAAIGVWEDDGGSIGSHGDVLR